MRTTLKGRRRNTSALPALTPSYEKPQLEDSISKWYAFAEEQARMQKHIRKLTDNLHDLRARLHKAERRVRFLENAAKLTVSSR